MWTSAKFSSKAFKSISKAGVWMEDTRSPILAGTNILMRGSENEGSENEG